MSFFTSYVLAATESNSICLKYHCSPIIDVSWKRERWFGKPHLDFTLSTQIVNDH